MFNTALPAQSFALRKELNKDVSDAATRIPLPRSSGCGASDLSRFIGNEAASRMLSPNDLFTSPPE